MKNIFLLILLIILIIMCYKNFISIKEEFTFAEISNSITKSTDMLNPIRTNLGVLKDGLSVTS